MKRSGSFPCIWWAVAMTFAAITCLHWTTRLPQDLHMHRFRSMMDIYEDILRLSAPSARWVQRRSDVKHSTSPPGDGISGGDGWSDSPEEMFSVSLVHLKGQKGNKKKDMGYKWLLMWASVPTFRGWTSMQEQQWALKTSSAAPIVAFTGTMLPPAGQRRTQHVLSCCVVCTLVTHFLLATKIKTPEVFPRSKGRFGI